MQVFAQPPPEALLSADEDNDLEVGTDDGIYYDDPNNEFYKLQELP